METYKQELNSFQKTKLTWDVLFWFRLSATATLQSTQLLVLMISGGFYVGSSFGFQYFLKRLIYMPFTELDICIIIFFALGAYLVLRYKNWSLLPIGFGILFSLFLLSFIHWGFTPVPVRCFLSLSPLHGCCSWMF